MIRNVVLGRLRPEATPQQLDAALSALQAVRTEGLLEMRTGPDAGLREANWDYVITVDLVDAEAYRRYDLDEEHNRVRRELFVPISTDIARAQFLL